MPKLLTRREYAAHRDVPHQTVSAAIRRGAIPVRRDGKIDVAKADVAWTPTVRRPRKGAPRSTASDGVAPTAPPVTPEPESPPEPVPAAMTPHQRKAQAEAEAKELDLAVKRGQFVDVSTIAGTLQAFARRIQDGVLAIPDSAHKALAGRHRCACGAVIDVRPVTVELERHLRGVLAALAEDPLGQAK